MGEIILAFWIILSFIVGSMATDKSIGFWGGFFLSLLLSPLIGLIIVIIAPGKPDPSAQIPAQNLSVADEIAKFSRLYEDGIISKEDFEAQKNKLLNS